MRMPDNNNAMKPAARILLLGAIALAGCHTAKDVAVTSFRVIDAPANYVRRHLDSDSNRTTTTTTTVQSDAVTSAGHTVNPSPAPRDTTKRRTTQEEARPSPAPNASASPRVTRTDKTKPSPTPTQKNATNQSPQFPTARPVPGKPGYVFSPFDPSGGYVDVTGYASGSKVKDPYSGKIFLVP
jgi:hypothetical protein